MYGYEDQRYDTVKNFRVEAVENAFFKKPNPLYKPPPPWRIDPGFSYAKISLPKGKYATVDEALAACRKAFHMTVAVPDTQQTSSSPYRLPKGRKLVYVN